MASDSFEPLVGCYRCRHRTASPGSAHSRCRAAGDPMEAFFAILIGRTADLPRVELDPHGVRNGWAFWPVDFDPVWVRSCSAFDPVQAQAPA